MGHWFDRIERSDMASSGVRPRARPRSAAGGPAACAAAVLLLALAGCGESSNKSASVSSTANTASSQATTATAPTTPQTTSTATKSTPDKQATTPTSTSTTPTKTSTSANKPPAAKQSAKPAKPAKPEPIFGKVRVTSPVFKAGGPIPVKYTCDGANVSPPLEWGAVPHGTAEILILAVDLSGSASDAIQWAVAKIPPTATSIPEGHLPAGAVAGVNSEGKVGWGGICGAKGQLHRVGFLFYALKHPLGLRSGFDPSQIRGALKGRVAGTGLTLATYQRPA